LAFPPALLDEIRTRLPLNRLVERKLRLAKAGRDWKGLCPFHNEKSPSFHVFADHYHCYGCGAHGDHFRWVMETEKASFPEAVERLAAEAGLEVPRGSPEAAEAAKRIKDLHAVAEAVTAAFERRLWLPEGAAGLAYLRQRGLSDATIRKFRLGWSGEGRGALAADLARDDITPDRLVAVGAMKQDEDMKAEGKAPVDLFFGRVMFPILDPRGRVIAFGGRVLGDAVPKYVNSPETLLFKKSRTLYGAHSVRDALRAGQKLAVVEGYMDVIALAEAGHGAAVAPLGTALTEEHLEALWRLDPGPVLCFDGDAAGARAAERVMALALPHLTPGRSLAFVTLPGGEDPDTYIRRHGLSGFTALMERATPLASALYLAVAGNRAATPEERAAQQRRLEELAARIPDRTLRGEYQKYFRDAWFAAGRLASRAGPRGAGAARQGAGRGVAAPRPALSPEAARARLECELLLMLFDHPGVLAQVVETLSGVRFGHAGAESLRQALASHADDLFGLDSPQLLDHLRVLGLNQALDAVLGLATSLRPHRRLSGAAPGDALAAWTSAFQHLELERIDHEIAVARDAFRADPSPVNERRLARLAALRSDALSALPAESQT
jgi:DNA primase